MSLIRINVVKCDARIPPSRRRTLYNLHPPCRKAQSSTGPTDDKKIYAQRGRQIAIPLALLVNWRAARAQILFRGAPMLIDPVNYQRRGVGDDIDDIADRKGM